MVGDLEELLRDTAPQPTRPFEAGALVRRARRQVLAGRLAAGLGGVVAVVVAVLLAPSVAGIDQELEIAERPDSELPSGEPTGGEAPGGERSDAEQLWGRTYVSIEVIEDGAPRALVDGTRIELTLQREPLVRDADGGQSVDPEADGFAVWQAGCNRRESQLYLTDGRFELGGFGLTTAMRCPGDELADQDRWIEEFFRSGPTWELRDERLVLRADARTITFDEAPGSDAGPTGRTTSEHAPDAGTAAEHWPVELIYAVPGATPETERRMRFRGTSWAAWTIESSWTDDGPLPAGQWSAPGGPGLDPSDTWVEDRARWRGVSAELHPEWRAAVGLAQRVVVPLDQIPGARALIASLGLTPEEVEAYASRNVAGCDGPLDRCAPGDPGAARGIAHLATGFPLFAEQRYDGGEPGVWLVAEHFAFGDEAAQLAEVP